VEQAFLDGSQLPRSSFDVVYHCDLLAHFAEPISELNRMSALLRPGGVLCFEVGILGGLSSIWYKLIGEIGLGPHLWFFSNRSLKAMFEKSGLVVEETEYFGLAPEVVLGKVSGIFHKRVLGPLLRLLHPLGILPPPDVTEQSHQRTVNFLRYRVGHFAPRIGPQTLFVVARPNKYATPS
jgi:SAM-dependent methyltransferase